MALRGIHSVRIFFYHEHWSIMLVRQIPVTGSVKEMHLYGANKKKSFSKQFFSRSLGIQLFQKWFFWCNSAFV